MLRDFIWKTFEGTGRIDLYIFYKEIEMTKDEIKDSINDIIYDEKQELPA